MWQRILQPIPLCSIPAEFYTIAYASLHDLDRVLFPLYIDPSRLHSTTSPTSFFPTLADEYAFLLPFTKTPKAATALDAESETGFKTSNLKTKDISSLSPSPAAIGSTAVLVGLLRCLQSCSLVDVSAETGDGQQALAEEAAFKRGEIDEDTLHNLPGEKKTEAINRSPRSFKVDAIQAIANLTCLSLQGSSEVVDGQSLLGAASALELCLSQSRMDPHNPFAREWSILATKNLTEKHYGNQSRISSLKLQGVEHNEQLKKIGIDTWEDNGRVKIGQNPEAEKEKEKLQEPGNHPETKVDFNSGSVQHVSSVDDMLSELKEEYDLNVDYDFM